MKKTNFIVLTIFSLALIVFAEASIPGYTDFNYDRFTIHVNDNYIADNGYDFTKAFLDKFEARFNYMESLTHWTYDEIYGHKLEIYLEPTSGCYGGGVQDLGTSRKVTIRLHSPYDYPACKTPYRENSISKFGNPGELGDYWKYMSIMIHETMHGIFPSSVWDRKWLNEGFAVYQEHNVLEHFGDINQETKDYFIHAGTSYYNWDSYIANDYKDTSPSNLPIQSSPGYSITAQMLVNLEETYGDSMYNTFYNLYDNNLETLDWADQTASYLAGGMHRNDKVDSFMIHLFSLAANTDLIPTFRYDGPSGPGWGVRDIVQIGFMPDLSVTSITFSNQNPNVGDTVTAYVTITNSAQFDISADIELKSNSQNIVVPAQGSTQVEFPFTETTAGTYDITAYADKQNLKAESDESNNQLTQQITFEEIIIDNDNDGYAEDIDCNDNDANINPGATEVCNEVDDNCNLEIDEGDVCVYEGEYQTDSNTALLMHLNNNLNDESGATITSNGVTFNTGKFGQAAEFNEGNIKVESNGQFNFKEATLEAWVYPNDKSDGAIISRRGDNAFILSSNDGKPSCIVRAGGKTSKAESRNAMTPNEWHHLACVRIGSKVRVYLDGEKIKEAGVKKSFTASSDPFLIGGDLGNLPSFNGRIDEVRISDKARDVSEFNLNTPSQCTENWQCTEWSACQPDGTQSRSCTDVNSCGTTANKLTETQTCAYKEPPIDPPEENREYQVDANTALLMHLNNNLNDKSGATITSNGVTFNTGKFGQAAEFNEGNIKVESNGQFNFKEATLEAWVYPNDKSDGAIISRRGDNAFILSSNDGKPSCIVRAGGKTSKAESRNAMTPNEWHHLACVRVGSKVRVYLDGEKIKEAGVKKSFTASSDPFLIGGDLGNLPSFNGRIDEVRISDKARDVSEFNLI